MMRGILAWLALLGAAGAQDGGLWIQVPGSLAQEPELAIGDGIAWYRCVVAVPADWRGIELRVRLGRVGGSAETFVNGRRIGASAAADVDRDYALPADAVRAGAPNLIAVRVQVADPSTGGLLGEHPEIVCERGALPLRGTWRVRAGDDPSWAQWPAGEAAARLVALFQRASARPGIPLLRRTERFVAPPEPWFAQPARARDQALMVGNGRLRAHVFGDIERERIMLFEDTLWDGYPGAPQPGALQAIGDLGLHIPGTDEIVDYRRWLALRDGIAVAEWSADGARWRREVFASAVHQALVVRLESDAAAPLDVFVNLAPGEGGWCTAVDERLLELQGRIPRDHHASGEPAGVVFAALLGAVGGDAEIRATKGVMRVRARSPLTLLLTAATSMRFGDPRAVCRQRLAAAQRAVGELRAAHVADHRSLFGRVSLRVDDTSRAACCFDYGRCLLIAGSRPGSLPLLDGERYALDGPLQMSYWLAEVADLGECQRPLFDLIEILARTGQREAERLGCRGWVAHDATDAFGWAAPVGPQPWPFGGALLCLQMLEHYRFGGDRAFLCDEAYPKLRGATQCLLDLTAKRRAELDPGMACRVLLECEYAATVLGVDPELRAELSVATPSLMEAIHETGTARWPPFAADEPIGRAWAMHQQVGDGDAESAHATLRALFDGEHLPPAAAALGAAAAVAGMLVQHDGGLRLLPALPRAWPSGEARGLRAEGGFAVDLQWQDGALHAATIHARRGNTCRLHEPWPATEVRTANGEPVPIARPSPGILEFAVLAGGRYELRPR
jgi:alpha-L-fucosidase 2